MNALVQLNEIIEAAILARAALRDEREGDFRRHVSEVHKLATELQELTQQM